jgi:hypothetical protein
MVALRARVDHLRIHGTLLEFKMDPDSQAHEPVWGVLISHDQEPGLYDSPFVIQLQG